MTNQHRQICGISIGVIAALLFTPGAMAGNASGSVTTGSPDRLSKLSKQYAALQSPTSATGTTALIENGESVPFPKELTEWLQKRGFRMVNLIDGAGQIKAVDVQGREIAACTLEGTSIGGKCELGDIMPTNTNQVSILGYTPKTVAVSESTANTKSLKDDPCVWQIVNNRLVKICW